MFDISHKIIYACNDRSLSKTQGLDNKPCLFSIFIDLERPFHTFNYKSF